MSSLQGTGSALATVPNALVRWTEESRVLDGDSLHDCMTACKPQILEVGKDWNGQFWGVAIIDYTCDLIRLCHLTLGSSPFYTLSSEI